MSINIQQANSLLKISDKDKFNNSNVSSVQTTLTATKAYNQNDPFIYNGQLYKADSAIASGGTIVISGTGQNASATTIEALINLHSGGGSGGHTILDSSGTAMNQRSKLQFVGATVTDDNANDKTIVTPTDTKNTAGSTDSSSKLFLIGATSQAANPQTYSQDTAYVGTDGNLYSGSKVVATQNMIGDAWVLNHNYAVGDYAIDANGLYKNGTAHTSTATNRPSVNQSGYWTLVSVTSQLKIGSTLVLDTSKEFIFKSGSGVQSLGNFILKKNSYSSTDSITVDTNKIRIICNRSDNGVQSPYGCFTNSFNSSLYLALVIEGQPISGYTWTNNNVFGSVSDSNTTYNNGHLGAAVQKDNSTFFMIYNLASFTGNKYLWLGSAGGRSYDLINAYLIKK